MLAEKILIDNGEAKMLCIVKADPLKVTNNYKGAESFQKHVQVLNVAWLLPQ